MADAIHYVDAPTRTPRRGGIKSIAEVRSDNRIAMGGQLIYTGDQCGIAVGSLVLCYPSPAAAQPAKNRDGIYTRYGIGNVFGGYYGVECWAGPDNDYEALAVAGLTMGEDRVIEAQIQTYISANSAQGTGLTITDRIAGADNLADQIHGPAPFITINRGDAVRAKAEGSLEGDRDGNLWTPNGTQVAASAFFTPGEVSAIGSVLIVQSEIIVNRVIRHETNKEYAIAERTYGVVIDCDRVLRYTAP